MSTPEQQRARLFTRREFLTYSAVMHDADLPIAIEAIASWAIDHPEVDMDERMTWAEWEEQISATD